MSRWIWCASGLLPWIWPSLSLACLDEAAASYQINPDLLYAIAKCESGLHAGVVNRSNSGHTGTYDIGLMQINSSHLPELAELSITKDQLFDVCINLKVGAWILADKIRRHGYSWTAVGAYNAACNQLKGNDCAAARRKYAWCVYRNLPTTSTSGSTITRTLSRSKVTHVTPIISVRVGPRRDDVTEFVAQ